MTSKKITKSKELFSKIDTDYISSLAVNIDLVNMMGFIRRNTHKVIKEGEIGDMIDPSVLKQHLQSMEQNKKYTTEQKMEYLTMISLKSEILNDKISFNYLLSMNEIIMKIQNLMKLVDKTNPGWYDKVFYKKKNNLRACDNCNSIGNMLKCGRCLRVYYCNRYCQRDHYKSHKSVCRKIVNIQKGSVIIDLE